MEINLGSRKRKLNTDLNDYKINSISLGELNFVVTEEDEEVEKKFGIRINFERKQSGINGILINYHMMCAMLVFVASINFLIDPEVVPGRAGLLVTIYLVLTSFFSSAQVFLKLLLGIFLN